MPTTRDLLDAADRFMFDAADLTPDEFEAALSAWLGDADTKAERIAALRRVSVDKAAQAKALAEEYVVVRKRHEGTADRCGVLMDALLRKYRELGSEPKIPGVARLQKNGGKAPLVGEPDAATLPDDLVAIKRIPNNDAIRMALAAGREVPGVTLGEVSESVRWE